MKVNRVERKAIRKAARWHAALNESTPESLLLEEWRTWRDSSPVRQWAWLRVEKLSDELQPLKSPQLSAVIDRTSQTRWRVRRGDVLMGVVCVMAVAAHICVYA